MNTANLTFKVQEIFGVQCLPDHVQILMKLIRLIEKHFIQQRSPAFYADALSIHEATLSKYSKMVLGKTVYELIQDKIHHEAVKLLVTTEWSVKRIAYEVGCSDPCYFNRCFKKKTGITPKKFRTYGFKRDLRSLPRPFSFSGASF